MAAEVKREIQLEIAHVLFIDIVSYSKLLITEQSEQLQTLKEIVRATEQFRIAEAAGKLLRLSTGDGGALVFRTNPEAPVLCALEISKALKDHPELRVRMGIHSGPVNEVTDLNEQANIAGAGINIAQRVMDCGDAGIFFSRGTWQTISSITLAGGRICMRLANARSNTAKSFRWSISTRRSWVTRIGPKTSGALRQPNPSRCCRSST